MEFPVLIVVEQAVAVDRLPWDGSSRKSRARLLRGSPLFAVVAVLLGSRLPWKRQKRKLLTKGETHRIVANLNLNLNSIDHESWRHFHPLVEPSNFYCLRNASSNSFFPCVEPSRFCSCLWNASSHPWPGDSVYPAIDIDIDIDIFVVVVVVAYLDGSLPRNFRWIDKAASRRRWDSASLLATSCDERAPWEACQTNPHCFRRMILCSGAPGFLGSE